MGDVMKFNKTCMAALAATMLVGAPAAGWAQPNSSDSTKPMPNDSKANTGDISSSGSSGMSSSGAGAASATGAGAEPMAGQAPSSKSTGNPSADDLRGHTEAPAGDLKPR